MRHAVILAGGSGTRLWPASRRSRPKQLLPLTREGLPMIAEAVALARSVADDVVIVTAEDQVASTLAAVASVELIIEPCARNTAAAIGLAGAMIAKRDPSATIAVLPADHHVRDRAGMSSALIACLTAAEDTDAIALVGIPPTRPETGFGYLEMAAGLAATPRPVLRFVEKPDAARAATFFGDGRHLWNAGIFCLTTRRLLTELDAHLPQTASAVRQLANADFVSDPRGLYQGLPSISFDHAVMEKTVHVVAVAADVGWSDVGSWSAIAEVKQTDDRGNVTSDSAIVLDGTGNVVLSEQGTLIATIGVSDLVIVKSGNAILVVRKDQAQRVREVVDELTRAELTRYL